jgi:GGDEF domain-containing protein
MTTPFVPSQRKTEDRHVAVLAFDIRRFSAFTDTERTRIASEFRDDIEEAFRGTDLQEAWSEREFCQNGGDGIVVGFPDRHLRGIVDRLPQALQHRLRERHQQGGSRLRMRLGIAVGPVQGIVDDRVDVAPNQTIIDACRIGDSKATRMLLENSDEDATYLAVAVTSAVITGTIGPDPVWLRASEFVKVAVDMADKHYHAEAHLHVPSPSGDLLRFGLANLPRAEISGDDSVEPLEAVIEKALTELPPTAGGQASNAHAGGDLHDESTRIGEIGRDAIGVGSGNRVRDDHSTRDDHSRRGTVRQGNVFNGDVSTGDGGTLNAFGGDQHNNGVRPSPQDRGERR